MQVRRCGGWGCGSGSRFLQTDPIPGGSANNYDYANQDPINSFDLDGSMAVGDSGAAGCSLACTAGSYAAFQRSLVVHHHHHHWWSSPVAHISGAARASAHFVGKHRELIENVALGAGLALTGGEGLFIGYEAFEAYRAEDTGAAALKIMRAYAKPGWRREVGAIGGALDLIGVHGSWARRHRIG